MPTGRDAGVDWEAERTSVGRHFLRDMEGLWTDVLEMAAVVESTLKTSLRALRDGRGELAAAVKGEEKAVDAWEVRIERACVKVLALHQPVASDLRRVAAILRVNGDLERIADLSSHIANRARKLAKGPDHAASPPELDDMATLVQARVRDALDALTKADVELARAVIVGDKEVNRVQQVVLRQLKQAIRRDPEQVNAWLRLINTARNLERIADHAASIAEAVIYMREGDIVRHAGAAKDGD